MSDHVINPAYYAAFAKAAKRNEKMKTIPTKEQLEAAGCSVSGMGYLVAPDARQFRADLIAPDLLPDGVRELFTGEEPPAKKPEHSEEGSDQRPNFQVPTKVCEACGEEKLLELEFAKDGRSKDGHAKKCNACKGEQAEEQEPSAPPPPPPPPPPEPKMPAQPSGPQPGHREEPTFVPLGIVKALVQQAYERGKKEGMGQVNAYEPTLDELLHTGS